MPFKCKDCGAALHKRGDGSFAEDQRKAPAAGAAPYAGVKRRAGEQTPPAPPGPQSKPRRDHFLTRPLFGGAKKEEAPKA